MFKFRFLVFVLPFSLIGLTITTSPAQAIFGLSKCEKIKKQIYTEISLGDSLFKQYRIKTESIEDWKTTSNISIYEGQMDTAIRSLILLSESDLKVLKIADANGPCFSIEQRTDFRSSVSTYKELLKLAKAWIKNKNYYNGYSPKNVIKTRLISKSKFSTKN